MENGYGDIRRTSLVESWYERVKNTMQETASPQGKKQTSQRYRGEQPHCFFLPSRCHAKQRKGDRNQPDKSRTLRTGDHNVRDGHGVQGKFIVHTVGHGLVPCQRRWPVYPAQRKLSQFLGRKDLGCGD